LNLLWLDSRGGRGGTTTHCANEDENEQDKSKMGDTGSC
jgi:hypothetical protein